MSSEECIEVFPDAVQVTCQDGELFSFNIMMEDEQMHVDIAVYGHRDAPSPIYVLTLTPEVFAQMIRKTNECLVPICNVD